MAAIGKNNSSEQLVAEQQGVAEAFRVIVNEGFALDYHDVFRRVSDGQVFRVTSNAKDSDAPKASTVQIAKVTAEKWVIPGA